MIIDDLTIIVSIILLVFALVTPLVNKFFRTPAIDEEGDTTPEQLPGMSVIIIAHGNAKELDDHLSLFLTQDYGPGYEVIVVTSKSDSESEDVLKQYANNPHLYTTFTPDSSRYMSRRKLAITLGVKAAKNEWVVLTDAYCHPASDEWLKAIAGKCTESTNLVLGYTQYDDEASAFSRFEKLGESFYLFREAQQGTAYRSPGKNIAFRKSEFMAQNGYQGNLKYIYGEYDFLVNKYAKDGCTNVVTRREGWMIEDSPSAKRRRNTHIYYQETRKHLQRSLSHRLLFNADQWAIHLNWLAIIAALVVGTLTQRWIIDIAAGVALILSVLLRTWIARRALRLFDEHTPAWKIVFYETGILWHNLAYKLWYAKTDKYDFICHKI